MINSPITYEVLSASSAIPFATEWYELIHPKHFWLEWRIRAFKRQARELGVALDKPWHVLEVGCGTGLLTQQIENVSNWEIDGADINEAALSRHRAGRGKLYCYNVSEKNPKLRNKYDAIILFDIIEHIEQRQAFLEDCLYHLKPGGWIFVNVPALQSAFSAYDRALGHQLRFRKRNLSLLLDDSGIQTLDIRYWGFSLLPLLYFRKSVLNLKNWISANDGETVRIGMAPPTEWINSLLAFIGYCECRLLGKYPLGSSILAAARKPR